MMSGEPPAPTVTIKRTGRDGKDCALAIPDPAGRAAAPAAKRRNSRRGSFMMPHQRIAATCGTGQVSWQKIYTGCGGSSLRSEPELLDDLAPLVRVGARHRGELRGRG